MQLLRKIILSVLAIGIVVFGFLMMKYFSSMKEDPPQRPGVEAKRYVKTKKVSYSDIPTFIESSGRVVSGQNVALISEVGGRILSGDVPFKEGKSFKKGQVLYRIDRQEAAYNLSAQKSQFLTSLAAILPDIKIDFPKHFDAMKKFFEDINVEKNLPKMPDLNDSNFKTFLATKNVLNQYYTIKSLEERLQKYTFSAPFDGTIANVILEVGSVANPGATIAQIIQTNEYEIEIPISTEDVDWISVGQEVQLTNEDNGNTWSGTVIRISDYLDPNTQSANVYVSVKGKDKVLYDGMYLLAKIPGPNVDQAVEIPRKAIFNKENVYVVENEKLQTRVIDIKKLNTQSAIIGGLEEGAVVVVESVPNGFDNMPVQTNKNPVQGS